MPAAMVISEKSTKNRKYLHDSLDEETKSCQKLSTGLPYYVALAAWTALNHMIGVAEEQDACDRGGAYRQEAVLPCAQQRCKYFISFECLNLVCLGSQVRPSPHPIVKRRPCRY